MPSVELTGAGRRRAHLTGLRQVDVWLAGGMAVAAVAVAVATETGPLYRGEDAFGLGLAAAAGLVLLWRRTLPLVAMSGAAAVVVINAAAGFPTGLVPW